MANKAKVERKLPERRCIGCGEHFAKNTLIRVVRSPEGEITLDFVGKAPGRGAYLCKSTECFAKARKTRRLEASFAMRIDDSVYEALEERLSREKS